MKYYSVIKNKYTADTTTIWMNVNNMLNRR